jgi:F-type H+-transporting ATPase subunit b
MKRLILAAALAILTLALPAALLAQQSKSEASSGESTTTEIWEWANFLILAGGLGYVVVKYVPPAFDARGKRIRKDMVEAEEIRKAAEARMAEVERRLAHLGDEIAALRAEAQREEAAENARFARETAAEIAKLQANAEQEIDSAAKAARMELKRYAAELALDLAQEKLRARITPETEDRLVRGFLKNLIQPPSSAGAA